MRSLIERLLATRLSRFAVVGLSGVFVNLLALWLLADLVGVQLVLSSAIAIEVSIISNFLLNNAWTFRDRNDEATTGFTLRMVRFNLVCLVGMAIQLGTFIALTQLITSNFGLQEPGLWKYPSQLAGIAVATGWNFLSNFHWTWAQKRQAPAPPEARPDTP